MSSGPCSPPHTSHQKSDKEEKAAIKSNAAAAARKRMRATPKQLELLEKTFSINPSPNNRMREQMSKELAMSERSIQIWFQNRRAKQQQLQQQQQQLQQQQQQHQQTLMHDMMSPTDAYGSLLPATYMPSTTPNNTTPTTTPTTTMNMNTGSAPPFSLANMPPPPPPPPMPSGLTTNVLSNHIPHVLSAETLQIGSWKRMRLGSEDLVCSVDPKRQKVVWCICDGQTRFKLEFGTNMVRKIRLVPHQEQFGWARLELHLIKPESIAFYMQGPARHTWTQCRDFTQDKQATAMSLHLLEGPAVKLQAEWSRILQADPQLQHLLDPATKSWLCDPRHATTHEGKPLDGQLYDKEKQALLLFQAIEPQG
ncbi:hypothetical protein J3Q64DRAFT_1641798 [Phycomyces blakesleeanus]|uniref:Homeobox domain-containing protein n=1 Tax=Phycomyces blakesleeanus TaxID=4837 RepID=A0ABR3AWK6_PHYBL